MILEIFKKSKETSGYRRIQEKLDDMGLQVNHKRILRLTKELGIQCTKYSRKSRRYNSYKGIVGIIAKNLINRRFTTPFPLQKLVTDVTEFKCLNGEKLYLSPIMDLYNLEIISFKVSKKPTLDLVIDPLKEALSIVKKHANYRTTIHSDQG